MITELSLQRRNLPLKLGLNYNHPRRRRRRLTRLMYFIAWYAQINLCQPLTSFNISWTTDPEPTRTTIILPKEVNRDTWNFCQNTNITVVLQSGRRFIRWMSLLKIVLLKRWHHPRGCWSSWRIFLYKLSVFAEKTSSSSTEAERKEE